MPHTRRFFCLAAIWILSGLAVGHVVHAQSALPTLHLSTNQAVFGPGNSLAVTVGVEHAGAPVVVDLLFGVILPGGDSVIFFEGPGLVPGTGRVSQLASIRPMLASLPLGPGTNVIVPDFFRYTWQGQEPLGQYQIFFAATAPGAFADGRVDGGDLLALQIAPMSHVPPATVTVDPSRASSAAISMDGGTVGAVGADGAQYTLTIPPAALERDTVITLMPLLSMTGLPGSLQTVSGIRAEPAGLTFAIPATLTIRPPAGGASAGAVGVLTSSGGAGAQLLPAAAAPDGVIYIPNITHFSVVATAVPGSLSELSEAFPASSFRDAVVAAHDNPALQRSVLERWFDQLIWSLLRTGQTDTTSLLKGMHEFVGWQGSRIIYSVAQTPLTSPAIQIQAGEGRRLIADGLRAAIARHNSLCVSERSLARAEEVMRLQALAESTAAGLVGEGFVQAGFITSLQPSLDLTGLTRAGVVENLCVRVAILSTSFPGSASLEPGVPATLIVNAGLAMRNGSAPLFTPPLQVVVDAIGATPAQRLGQTNSSGNFQTTFVPQTTGMSLNVLVAMTDGNFPYLSLGLAVATKTIGGVGGVIVTPSQTTIAPGASRQFSATVEGTTNQAVTWSVTGGGTITQSGLFTSNGALGTFFVKATSVQNPDSVGIAQVTVAAVSVLRVFPERPVIDPGASIEFSALVDDDSDVTWSVEGGGTITPIDFRRARFTSSGATGMFTVTATSVVNPSISGTATAVVYNGTVVRAACVAGSGRPIDNMSCGFEYLAGAAGSTPVSSTVTTTNPLIEISSNAGRVFLISTSPDRGGGTVEIRFEGLGVVNTVRYIFEYTETAATVRCEGSRCDSFPFP